MVHGCRRPTVSISSLIYFIIFKSIPCSTPIYCCTWIKKEDTIRYDSNRRRNNGGRRRTVVCHPHDNRIRIGIESVVIGTVWNGIYICKREGRGKNSNSNSYHTNSSSIICSLPRIVLHDDNHCRTNVSTDGNWDDLNRDETRREE